MLTSDAGDGGGSAQGGAFGFKNCRGYHRAPVKRLADDEHLINVVEVPDQVLPAAKSCE